MTKPRPRLTPGRQSYIDALPGIAYAGMHKAVPLGELTLWVERPACTWRVLLRGHTVAEGFVPHYTQVAPALRVAVRRWVMTHDPKPIQPSTPQL
jgi:hypothetical protein